MCYFFSLAQTNCLEEAPDIQDRCTRIYPPAGPSPDCGTQQKVKAQEEAAEVPPGGDGGPHSCSVQAQEILYVLKERPCHAGTPPATSAPWAQ